LCEILAVSAAPELPHSRMHSATNRDDRNPTVPPSRSPPSNRLRRADPVDPPSTPSLNADRHRSRRPRPASPERCSSTLRRSGRDVRLPRYHAVGSRLGDLRNANSTAHGRSVAMSMGARYHADSRAGRHPRSVAIRAALARASVGVSGIPDALNGGSGAWRSEDPDLPLSRPIARSGAVAVTQSRNRTRSSTACPQSDTTVRKRACHASLIAGTTTTWWHG